MNIDQQQLKIIVKTYYDLQEQLLRYKGRIGLKKDNNLMDRDSYYTEETLGLYTEGYIDSKGVQHPSLVAVIEDQMLVFEKQIKSQLKKFPIYTDWLMNVKGVGWSLSAVLISSFDIYLYDKPSSFTAFAGLNPGKVLGKKPVETKNPKTYKSKEGFRVVRELKESVIVETDEYIRGDKQTRGFMSPYNSWLRTKLCGVLADSFIRGKTYYAMMFYYSLHVPVKKREELGFGRMDLSENICESTGKMWKDESEGHRHMYARRKMIKQFLIDFHIAWRTIEGLPVRPSYQEEYLGHKHSEKVS